MLKSLQTKQKKQNKQKIQEKQKKQKKQAVQDLQGKQELCRSSNFMINIKLTPITSVNHLLILCRLHFLG